MRAHQARRYAPSAGARGAAAPGRACGRAELAAGEASPGGAGETGHGARRCGSRVRKQRRASLHHSHGNLELELGLLGSCGTHMGKLSVMEACRTVCSGWGVGVRAGCGRESVPGGPLCFLGLCFGPPSATPAAPSPAARSASLSSSSDHRRRQQSQHTRITGHVSGSGVRCHCHARVHPAEA